jgi:ABC-type nitrate/sulfonate/bicarbonate transport system permease component
MTGPGVAPVLWRVARARAARLGFLGGLGILVAGWHVLSVYVVDSVLFPPPLAVLRRAAEMIADGTLPENLAASLQRILIGFTIGSSCGIAIGLTMGLIRPARVLIDPMVETLRFIPAVAMITVAVIWFGIGEESKVFIIIYASVFVVVITTVAGVGGIEPNKIRAAQSMGLSRRQMFTMVTLPAAAPQIFTGMRLAMGNAFTTIVAAELVAAKQGIGTLLWKARLFMLVDDVFVALLCLALLGFAIDRLFRWLILRFAGRYSPVL